MNVYTKTSGWVAPDHTARRDVRVVGPDRVISGVGAVDAVPRVLDRLCAQRVVLATSRSLVERTPLVDELQRAFGARLVATYPSCREHAPRSTVEELTDLAADARADALVSLGGSSTIDTVKAVGLRLSERRGTAPPPHVTVSTTLSAGEFTPGVGITDDETHVKDVIADVRLMPRVIVLDPAVTAYTPTRLWLGSGIKALDHALEALWAIAPHPYATALAERAVELLVTQLPTSADPEALDARGACQLAAWMGIDAVFIAGMRLSHFLSYELAALGIAHGETSCILLPAVMRHVAPSSRDGQVRIARAMGIPTDGRDPATVAAEAADALRRFIADRGLPTTLTELGVDGEQLDAVAASGFAAASRLHLTDDLPDGAATVRAILASAG